MEIKRGNIYYLTFDKIFDTDFPVGKGKFVLVLQEGVYFQNYNYVEILFVTSDKTHKQRDNYFTDVEIEPGQTKLKQRSWVICAQPYPISKSLFEKERAWCAGQLSEEKMAEIDKGIYQGLCMNLQNELEKEDTFADNFGKFLLGALVGGIVGAGVATYIKNHEAEENDQVERDNE